MVATFVANAQNRQSLRFEETTFDFGQVAEGGGVVEHRFRVKNCGEQPVVILQISSSCGCTKASYTRRPIMAGDTTSIVVSYNPWDQPAGTFSRTLSVVTSEGRIADGLCVRGRVVPRERSVTERYPLSIGSGVRIDRNAHSFGYIEHGQMQGAMIAIINDSPSPATLHLVPISSSGQLQIEAPERLMPHSETAINFRYDIPSDASLYGTIRDYFRVEVNGEESEYILTISAIVIDPRDMYADRGEAQAEVSEKIVKFGTLKRGVGVTERVIVLKNTGDETLWIRAVEAERNEVLLRVDGSSEIEPGGSTRIRVGFSTAERQIGAVVDRIRIITSDPKTPMQTVKVAAIIEN